MVINGVIIDKDVPARRVSSSVASSCPHGAENREVTHNIFIFIPVTIK